MPLIYTVSKKIMIKFDEIKKKLENKVDLSKPGWVVISWFDENDNLLFCKWIIFSPDKRSINLKKLYDNFVLPNKKVKVLVIDIIEKTKEIKTTEDFTKIDLIKEGIFVWDIKNDNWAFILPNTEWINSIKQVIQAIKQKVNFSSKNVNIFSFTTKRFTIS